MKKEDVLNMLNKVQTEIKEIETSIENDIVVYITKEKFLPAIGYISEICSFKDLIKAQIEIDNSSLKSDSSMAILELGLTEDEIPKEQIIKILGFPAKYWNQDIKTRLDELRREIRLDKLINAEAQLEKHLSNEDKFAMDTKGIESLFE
jgi:hypothetical protein